MLLYDATEMTISKKKGMKPLKCLGGIVYARGKDDFSLAKFPHTKLADGLSLELVKDRHQAQGFSKSIGAIWNSPFLINKLKGILHKVYNMYKLNAYLHHYQKYEIDKENFQNCFVEFENLIKNYEEA